MKKKTKPLQSDKYLIPRGDIFLQKLDRYFFDKSYEKIRDQLNMTTYTTGNTGITYRIINHWDKSGLLPASIKDKYGWRKFTLVELVWLKAIQHFREYGFSLDKIARVKKSVIDWNKSEEMYHIFEFYVAQACQSKEDIFIIALIDGTAGIGSSEDIEMMKVRHGKTNDMLLISLKSIITELGIKAPASTPLESLSVPEGEVISAVRHKGDRELKIKVKNQKIEEVESTHTEVDPRPNYLIHGQIEKERAYGSVMTQYEDGKRKAVRVTRKKRYEK